ncbi:MAG: VOC family protein [Actinomycetota bacterium]
MIPLASALAGGPVQVAYAVDDVVAAADRWAAAGVGPFVVRHHIEVTDAMVEGVPGVLDHSSAYGWWGAVMVELLAVHHPSALAATDGSTAPHHLAYLVDSFEAAGAELTDAGVVAAAQARAGGQSFAWYRSADGGGPLIEIYEATPGLLGFYDLIRNAAADWDGTTAILG